MNNKMNLISYFLVICVVFLSANLFAKDLTSRLGAGYANQFSVDGGLPSVALRYYPNPELGLSASLGIDTEKDASKFGFLAKVFRIVFMEDNMNFYMGGGLGLISREELKATGKTENDSGFLVTGFIGGEFFFSGLDSLGFSFESGVGVTSISSEVRFQTIGDHPIRAGMTFYF